MVKEVGPASPSEQKLVLQSAIKKSNKEGVPEPASGTITAIPHTIHLCPHTPQTSQETVNNFWRQRVPILAANWIHLGSCCYITSVVTDSVQPHRRQPTRLLRPWDSPGKNTGLGCHFVLQCMKVKSESEVAQSCPTLRDPMDCSLPGFSVYGIFQARVLEWIAGATRVEK